MRQHIAYLGIIVVLILLIFRGECTKPEAKKEEIRLGGKRYDVISSKTDTVYVYAKPEVRFKSGKTIYRDTTIYQNVPVIGIGGLNEDMSQQYYDSVLLEYFAKRVYSDTIKFGEYGNVYIKDTIQENAILARTALSDLKFPTSTSTITVKDKPKNQLYLGAKAILMNSNIQAVGSGIMLRTKRDRIYGIGAVVDRQKNVNFTLDFHIKL